MRKVAVFSALLLLGLLGSQWLPFMVGTAYESVREGILLLTMIALGFIMIHVGYEFELDRSNLRQYGWDYIVAFSAAFFPWLFVSLYLVFAMLPEESWTLRATWQETLLVGRFASPTATGVLFSMLAAAGLSATWLYRKARVLVIFDDLDTVLLLVPLQALIIGWAWQSGATAALMVGLLATAYVWLHRVQAPSSWPWIAAYAVAVAGVCKLIEIGSRTLDKRAAIHLDVLLPAFVLGCLLKRPSGSDPHRDDVREGHQKGPESADEQRASTVVAAGFMLLVGLSMPPMFAASGFDPELQNVLARPTVANLQPALQWPEILVHVLLVTALANLGKMVPALCYRREAHWRERLALAIAMWPRGEVGAAILVISMSYGIGGPVLTVATLSLALNVTLTGIFIVFVKKLLAQAATIDDKANAKYAAAP